jgi:hypothetical protein
LKKIFKHNAITDTGKSKRGVMAEPASKNADEVSELSVDDKPASRLLINPEAV